VNLEDRTVHSNTVEGYFSIFKRGMKGVYQHCGENHLHRYLAEFEFRYNNREALGCNDAGRSDRVLGGIMGKRLTYRGSPVASGRLEQSRAALARSVSFTIHPSAQGADYLTVSDAMHQILDLVAALESTEAGDSIERKIVWRLTDAHTNSPPFTVTASAFPRHPTMVIDVEAQRVTRLFAETVRGALHGQVPTWVERPTRRHLESVMKRNLNGIGLSEIVVDDERLNVVPAVARTALAALHEPTEEIEDKSRIEYGSIEGRVVGLTTYYNNRALVLLERLSEKQVVCSLTDELAAKLGPTHQWQEAWEGSRLLIGGEIVYGADGTIRKVNASYHEELPWTDVSLADVKGIDLLQGRTTREHLEKFWGRAVG
jgi:hypothetical protein